MGLQRKTSAGIQTQVWQPYPGENHAALAEWGPRSFGERGEPRVFGVLPFAMWLRKQERLCLEEKG